MKNLLIIASMVITHLAYAQPYKTIKVYRPYKWMFGLHWAVVEDDGYKFDNLFDANKSWNIAPFPTQLTVDRYFIYGWSMEFGARYTEYLDSKLINDTTGVSGMNFSFDINGKYSFYNSYAPRARWIDPFVTFGVGYTYRDVVVDPHVPTVNLGGGINFWIINPLGIRISSQAKFAVYPTVWETHGNYLQHTIGIVFRTAWEKGYKNPNSKKQHKWTKKQTRYKKKGGH